MIDVTYSRERLRSKVWPVKVLKNRSDLRKIATAYVLQYGVVKHVGTFNHNLGVQNHI